MWNLNGLSNATADGNAYQANANLPANKYIVVTVPANQSLGKAERPAQQTVKITVSKTMTA